MRGFVSGTATRSVNVMRSAWPRLELPGQAEQPDQAVQHLEHTWPEQIALATVQLRKDDPIWDRHGHYLQPKQGILAAHRLISMLALQALVLNLADEGIRQGRLASQHLGKHVLQPRGVACIVGGLPVHVWRAGGVIRKCPLQDGLRLGPPLALSAPSAPVHL